MSGHNLALALFAAFAIGLPLWGMQSNEYGGGNTHLCVDDCYQSWKMETGGVVAIAVAQAEMEASASPTELGKKAYAGCVACHGASGEGGIGPAVAGQSVDDIASKLLKYKAGEQVGSQSALMWGQAAMLSEADIDNIAAYISTL